MGRCKVGCGLIADLHIFTVKGGGRVVRVLELKFLSLIAILCSFSDNGCVSGLIVTDDCPARREKVRAMPYGISSKLVVIFYPQDQYLLCYVYAAILDEQNNN